MCPFDAAHTMPRQLYRNSSAPLYRYTTAQPPLHRRAADQRDDYHHV